MDQIIIKQITDKESSLAATLIQKWFEMDGIKNPNIPSNDYLEQVLNTKYAHLWVALWNDEVVGGMTAYVLPMFDRMTKEVFLYEIGVIEKFQRKGIARALIQHLISACEAYHAECLYVATEVDNEAAKALYENTGGQLEVVAWYTYPVMVQNRNKGNEAV